MKIVRLAIFLTGIMGLAMGGLTTISSLKASQEEASLKANENLKSQGALFVDQFYGMIEAVKSLPPGATEFPSYVMRRAVVKLSQGVPTEIEPLAQNEQRDLGLEDRVLAALKSSLSLGDLQILKIGLGTFAMSDMGKKRGIFVATPIYQSVNGVTDPSSIEKVNVTLIDPAKAFGGLQKVASADQAAYLIDKKGRVLAHSSSSFVGTDLGKTDHLKDTIESLFLGAQTGSVGKYTGVDGVKEQVAFVRAGTYPFAFGVEQRAAPSVLSGAWFAEEMDSGPARKNLGLGLIALALALAAMGGMSIYASRHIDKQIEASAGARKKAADLPISTARDALVEKFAKVAPKASERKPFAKSTPTSEPRASEAFTLEQAASAFVETRAQLHAETTQAQGRARLISANRDYTRDFVSKIEKGHTLEGVEKELVQIASELTESPVLYFRYHRRNQNLTLSNLAGEVKIPNYALMQAYVRKDIEAQVERLSNEGKVASISNYGPMSKLMISQLNVAHFEAWAVTSDPAVSVESKLVGVLVVLQAGTKSAQARPILAKILKESGNYLYAQGNKIRPRTVRTSSDQASPLS